MTEFQGDGQSAAGPVRIGATLLAALIAEADACPKREVCGILFGTAEAIEQAKAADNVAADPARFFELDPAALIAALRAERGGGPRVIGHYHSHPSGSAIPSAHDFAAAQPSMLTLIVAAGRAQLWRADANGFTEVQLLVDEGASGVQGSATASAVFPRKD